MGFLSWLFGEPPPKSTPKPQPTKRQQLVTQLINWGLINAVHVDSPVVWLRIDEASGSEISSWELHQNLAPHPMLYGLFQRKDLAPLLPDNVLHELRRMKSDGTFEVIRRQLRLAESEGRWPKPPDPFMLPSFDGRDRSEGVCKEVEELIKTLRAQFGEDARNSLTARRPPPPPPALPNCDGELQELKLRVKEELRQRGLPELPSVRRSLLGLESTSIKRLRAELASRAPFATSSSGA